MVSGRNGSGKSSFAEALELALTGTSYRWRERQSLWSESWRNLHKPNPCAVRVEFTQEGTGQVTVGVDWTDEAELDDRDLWTQSGGNERSKGIDGLGWSNPLELYRPVLSYEELGRLFDGGPSVLYDALAKLLGLDVLTAVEKKLTADLKVAKESRDAADGERRQLMAALGDVTDERVVRMMALLRKRPPPLDEVVSVITGAGSPELNVVAALRDLSGLTVPSIDDIASAASELRAAVADLQRVAVDAAALVDKRVGVLHAALDFHQHAGDTSCPVCGGGQLDADWVARAHSAVAEAETSLAEYRSATGQLKAARQAAANLAGGFLQVAVVPGVELAGLEGYNKAAIKAAEVPADDLELADHVESNLVDAVGAADALRDQASAELSRRQDVWAPLAEQVAAWLPNERHARESDDRLKALTAAPRNGSPTTAPSFGTSG